MDRINIEIKARVSPDHQERIRTYLKEHDAVSKGIDHQIDTYFHVPDMGPDGGSDSANRGTRLKLRQGTLENYLVFYDRPNSADPKPSLVKLYKCSSSENNVETARDPGSSEDLKDILSRVLGTRIVVEKHREIYFLDNVKIHIDRVSGLGTFMEIEAIGDHPDEAPRLRAQVDELMEILDISRSSLCDRSYSDMIFDNRTT